MILREHVYAQGVYRWRVEAGACTYHCMEVDVYGSLRGAGVHMRGALGCVCGCRSRVWCNVQKGLTVLYLAAQAGNKEVVEMLLGAGADANAVDAVRAAMGGSVTVCVV